MHMHPRPGPHDRPPRHAGSRHAGRETPMFNATTCSFASDSPTFGPPRPSFIPSPEPGASVLDRTRRTIGRGLIAVGTLVAGADPSSRPPGDVRPDRDTPLAH